MMICQSKRCCILSKVSRVCVHSPLSVCALCLLAASALAFQIAPDCSTLSKRFSIAEKKSKKGKKSKKKKNVRSVQQGAVIEESPEAIVVEDEPVISVEVAEELQEEPQGEEPQEELGEEWATVGHEYLQMWVKRFHDTAGGASCCELSLIYTMMRVPLAYTSIHVYVLAGKQSYSIARITGWIPSDDCQHPNCPDCQHFIDADDKPAPLWHIQFTDGDLAGTAEDLEAYQFEQESSPSSSKPPLPSQTTVKAEHEASALLVCV